MDIRKLLRKAIYVDEDTTLHNVTFQDITGIQLKDWLHFTQQIMQPFYLLW